MPTIYVDEYNHELISVNLPRPGLLVFTCSSNPKISLTAYERVRRCPMCRKNNPLLMERGGKVNS